MSRKPQRERARGMWDDEYEALLAAQGGVCAICGNPPKEGGRRFHVDHDHKTGAIRGLLCFRCNRFLPTWITASLAYRVFEYLARAEQRTRDEKDLAEFERKREKWIA